MGLRRRRVLPILLAGLLVGACATTDGDGARAPAGSDPDAPVSDTDGRSSAAPPSADGRGTAVIAVRAKASGQPLPQIPVQVRTVGWPMPAELAIDIARMTDAKGEYVWTHLPPGRYEFTVQVPGTDTKAARQVTVTADQTTRVDLELMT